MCFCLRQGKIFYVTTTSSTSTFSTASLCYVKKATDTVLITCKKRKRRLVDLSKIEGEDAEVMPSIVSSVVPREEEEDSHGLAEQDVEGGLRDGRFVNYWITTTVTSTTTGITTNYIYQFRNVIFYSLICSLLHNPDHCQHPMHPIRLYLQPVWIEKYRNIKTYLPIYFCHHQIVVSLPKYISVLMFIHL